MSFCAGPGYNRKESRTWLFPTVSVPVGGRSTKTKETVRGADEKEEVLGGRAG